MIKPNYTDEERQAQDKYKKKDKKKQIKMKVSGQSVKKLQKIIRNRQQTADNRQQKQD